MNSTVAPHFGQAAALSETMLVHSGHLRRAARAEAMPKQSKAKQIAEREYIGLLDMTALVLCGDSGPYKVHCWH
jgi:hypothetical protein